MEPHHVVIVGGGFGGLYAARRLSSPKLRVTLLDKRNFHLFQPLLYQVATGGLSPGDVASPLRAILRHQRNTQVLLGEAVDFDLKRQRVLLADGELAYDSLIVAAGAENFYFGNNEWEKSAPGLKTIEDAIEIRQRILLAFEAAERETDPEQRRAWLRFVVIGAGPTGVEMAGALGEIANDTLRGDFRSIRTEEAEILLLDMTPRVLPPYPPDLSAEAEKSLIGLGVRCLLNVKVTHVDREGVTYERKDGTKQHIRAYTTLWTAGVRPSGLAATLARQAGADLQKGHVPVEADLTLKGFPNVFVIGDMATREQDGKPLPGVAPVAMQQGTYVAGTILNRLAGAQTAPFRYHSRGDMATIGRAAAVAVIGKARFHGLLAWLLWLFIHLMFLVGFENKVVVFVEWAMHYYSLKRRSRLITGPQLELPKPPPPPSPAIAEQVEASGYIGKG